MRWLSLSGSLAAAAIFSPIAGYASLDTVSLDTVSLDTMGPAEKIEFLISSSEKTVEQLKKVHQAIIDFQNQEKACIELSPHKNNRGSDPLFELSFRAHTLLCLIEEADLQPYFRKEFLADLKNLSKAYKTESIPSVQLR